VATPIVFFGNERLATGVTTTAPTFRQLLRAKYDIRALVINNEPTVSRNHSRPEIVSLAEDYGVPVVIPEKLRDIMDILVRCHATVGVLAAYGKMVPQSIIDIFPSGIVNIHPSLLPLHRGPTPIESAILDGNEKTGVSLMQLVKAMDAGHVYAYRDISLNDTQSKQEIADQLGSLGANMLTTLLPHIINGEVRGESQDDHMATYDNLIVKDEGVLDWNKPARRLEREVRAYLGWPQSHTTLGKNSVIITEAHAEVGGGRPGKLLLRDKSLGVYTSEDILIIDRLKPIGKSDMSIAAFLNGYHDGLY